MLLIEILLTEKRLKTLQHLKQLIPQILAAAQKEYDSWAQDEEGHDEELGFGGLCQDIAEQISSVIIGAGIDAGTMHAEIGEQHVWTICKIDEGVYEVDIPPSVYETGGGYSWKKIPDVTFDAGDLVIHRIDPDPESFENYFGE